MRLLRQIHLWAGLAACLPLFLIGLSGATLLFREQIVSVRLPAYAAAQAPADAAARARDIATITALSGDAGWTTIRMPPPKTGRYEVYLGDDARAYYASGATVFADRFAPLSRPETFLFYLHTHLLMGEAGEIIAGVSGLLAAGLTVTGIVIWLPGWRALRKRHFTPRDASRRTLLRAHTAWGVALCAPVLLSTASGAMMAFHTPVRIALQTIFADPPRVAPDWSAARMSSATNWAAVLANAEAALPKARIRLISAPSPARAAIVLRAQTALEWHPNGRSVIAVDPATARVLSVENADESGRGLRLANAIYPVHSASGAASPMTPVNLAAGLALAGLSGLGATAWLRRRRKRRAAAAGPAVQPAE